MITLKSAYDFYRLPEIMRVALIGQVFREANRDTLYFPVGLAPDEFNYGVLQGLIFVIPIMDYCGGGKWFRVGVKSPDDLDIDLDFKSSEVHVRQDVIEFLRTTDKHNVTYRDLLTRVQQRFGGELS